MTVNELIERLEELNGNTKLVFFDGFGCMFTSSFEVDSWRGSYNMPAAIVYMIDNKDQGCTVKDALKELKKCEGKKVYGYKGGEFILSSDSTLFLVASDNVAGNAVTISEICDDGYCMLEEDAY